MFADVCVLAIELISTRERIIFFNVFFIQQDTNIFFYQSPLILTELFQHDLINVSYLTACYLYQVMMTLHFLNDVADDAESTYKSKMTS